MIAKAMNSPITSIGMKADIDTLINLPNNSSLSLSFVLTAPTRLGYEPVVFCWKS